MKRLVTAIAILLSTPLFSQSFTVLGKTKQEISSLYKTIPEYLLIKDTINENGYHYLVYFPKKETKDYGFVISRNYYFTDNKCVGKLLIGKIEYVDAQIKALNSNPKYTQLSTYKWINKEANEVYTLTLDAPVFTLSTELYK